MQYINKNCSICGELMIGIPSTRQQCDNCKKKRRKEICHNHYNSKLKPKQQDRQKEYKDYFEELISINSDPKYLTTKGFNSISKFSISTYCNSFDISWLDWLKQFNKYDELVNYILKEYSYFYDATNSQDLKNFSKKHEYITIDILTSIGLDFIRDKCGIIKSRRDNEYYKNNFIDIVNKIGHVPLFHEFAEISPIPPESYSSRFKLKGKVYDNIVKMYVGKDEFTEYKILQQQHKTNVGKITSTINKNIISLADLEEEFRKVFDECFLNNAVYPSRRLFNKLSKFDDRTYRKKLGLSWTKVCESYEYKVDRYTNKFEKYVLGTISKILNVECDPQKSFEWLIGINNYPLFCDGVFEDCKLVVETDGKHHKIPMKQFGGYERFEIQKQNDKLKDYLVKEHGYTMIRIDIDSDWSNIDYLKLRLLENDIKVA